VNIPDEFYQRIVKSMPIPCVDLLVSDRVGKVLMLKRKEPPAKGQWWFPGGRVLYGELRLEAAHRKLKEECSLEGRIIREVGTYDLIFNCECSNHPSHGITTVFHMTVNQNEVRLDNQSSDYRWQGVDTWLREVSHEFLVAVLEDFIS
jgi:colanic acid biosynthesis protein WcaH